MKNNSLEQTGKKYREKTKIYGKHPVNRILTTIKLLPQTEHLRPCNATHIKQSPLRNANYCFKITRRIRNRICLLKRTIENVQEPTIQYSTGISINGRITERIKSGKCDNPLLGWNLLRNNQFICRSTRKCFRKRFVTMANSSSESSTPFTNIMISLDEMLNIRKKRLDKKRQQSDSENPERSEEESNDVVDLTKNTDCEDFCNDDIKENRSVLNIKNITDLTLFAIKNSNMMDCNDNSYQEVDNTVKQSQDIINIDPDDSTINLSETTIESINLNNDHNNFIAIENHEVIDLDIDDSVTYKSSKVNIGVIEVTPKKVTNNHDINNYSAKENVINIHGDVIDLVSPTSLQINDGNLENVEQEIEVLDSINNTAVGGIPEQNDDVIHIDIDSVQNYSAETPLQCNDSRFENTGQQMKVLNTFNVKAVTSHSTELHKNQNDDVIHIDIDSVQNYSAETPVQCNDSRFENTGQKMKVLSTFNVEAVTSHSTELHKNKFDFNGNDSVIVIADYPKVLEDTASSGSDIIFVGENKQSICAKKRRKLNESSSLVIVDVDDDTCKSYPIDANRKVKRNKSKYESRNKPNTASTSTATNRIGRSGHRYQNCANVPNSFSASVHEWHENRTLQLQHDGIRQSGCRREIIIDGSNVALGHTNGAIFSVKGLQIAIDYFITRRHKVTAFVPQYRVKSGMSSDPRLLQKLGEQRLVIFTPSREVKGRRITPYDDRYIIQYATVCEGIVVSNDNFRDLLVESHEWRKTIERRLLMYTWVDDILMFPEDPMGRSGPRLSEFLKFP